MQFLHHWRNIWQVTFSVLLIDARTNVVPGLKPDDLLMLNVKECARDMTEMLGILIDLKM